MYFFSALYRGLRMIVAGIGVLAGAGVLIYGIVVAAPVFSVGGGLYFVTSVLLIIDTLKVLSDIKRDMDRLHTDVADFTAQNKLLKESRDRFENLNKDFALENSNLKALNEALAVGEEKLEQENGRLEVQVNNVRLQLENLETLKTSYESENERLAIAAKGLATENEAIRDSAMRLAATRDEMQAENGVLTGLLKDTQIQVGQLQEVKLEYEAQNAQYRNLLTENADKLEKSGEQIKDMEAQLAKLQTLFENTKKLVRNLVDAGDMFSSFSSTLGEDVSRIDNASADITQASTDLSSLVDRLNTQLTERDFTAGDTNQDGVIDADEFKAMIGTPTE